MDIKILRIITALMALMSFTYVSESQTTRTATTGLWNSSSTWSGAGVPSSNSVFVIPFGDTVTVNCNCGTYANSTIEVYGALLFPGGRKINLDGSGVVNVHPSGYMDGTNNGDKLIIGSNTVWTGNSPPISGPVTCDEIECYSNSTLPIELVSAHFELLTSGEIEATWTTASETDNEYFEILYSTDYLNWEVISRVMGAGNSSVPLDYGQTVYLNEVFKSQTVYLRLVQTDFDGTEQIVYEKTLELDVNDNGELLSLYPNPASEYLLIAGDAESVHSLVFNSIQGRMMKEVKIEQGITRINVKEHVSSGYYWVHIVGIDGQILASKKLSII